MREVARSHCTGTGCKELWSAIIQQVRGGLRIWEKMEGFRKISFEAIVIVQ